METSFPIFFFAWLAIGQFGSIVSHTLQINFPLKIGNWKTWGGSWMGWWVHQEEQYSRDKIRPWLWPFPVVSSSCWLLVWKLHLPPSPGFSKKKSLPPAWHWFFRGVLPVRILTWDDFGKMVLLSLHLLDWKNTTIVGLQWKITWSSFMDTMPYIAGENFWLEKSYMPKKMQRCVGGWMYSPD